jgi:Right handed beta helix region
VGTFGEPAVRGGNTSRREFLRMGGAGLAGIALFGVASPGLGQTTGGIVSALSLGIGPINTATTNRVNLVKALAYSTRHVVFPAGDYRIDNSGTPPIIRNFGGVVEFESGARFVFTNNRTKGLVFEGGTLARLYDIRTTFSTLPPVRVNAQECLHFARTTDTLIQNANVNGSAAAGILFGRSVRPTVRNATITNTRADGLHFANCQNARVELLRTSGTGDDGLAFVDYGGQSLHGGFATDVEIRNTGARGIAVVGQSNVEIANFLVDGTRGAGLYVARELSYGTATPANVSYHDGEVVRAGTVLKDGSYGANRHSLFYNGATDRIVFSRITSRCPYALHVATGGQPSRATLTDITKSSTC